MGRESSEATSRSHKSSNTLREQDLLTLEKRNSGDMITTYMIEGLIKYTKDAVFNRRKKTSQEQMNQRDASEPPQCQETVHTEKCTNVPHRTERHS